MLTPDPPRPTGSFSTVPDLRTWRRALTWQSRGAGLPGAEVEGSGLASGLRERTQRSSPAPRFCGAFQAERGLFSSRGGGTGGGKEAVSSHIRAELRPLPGFFSFTGARGVLVSNCRR